MIDLVGIHLGGAEAPIEGGGGGSTPTPTPLPSAGKPFVDKKDFQFDPVTHVVTLRARVADAGEVKPENVIGDPNYFPIPGIPTQLTGVLHLYNLKNSSGEDLLVDFGGTSGQVGVNRQLEPIVGVPIVTCLMSIFLCVIEFLSIREKAEEKTIKDMDRLLRVLADVVGRDRLRDILATRLDNTVNDRPS